ncbi:MAG: lamin tail domain-containing protein [Gemmatimonadetes bacterium]|nr:lamin tail domain-containing protein [Gemmatimonadota bacterium]
MKVITWTMAGGLLAVAAAGASLPVAAQVVFNEVLPAPGTDWTQNGSYTSSEDEWIELFNSGASPVDVTGWLVTDATGGTASPRMGLTGTMQPGEYLFITGEHASDWEALNGHSAVGLSLNNGGDALYLFQVAGGTTTQVDSVAWSSATTNVSFGPVPDGAGVPTTFDALDGGAGPQPTPGGPNGGPAAPKILASSVLPTFPTSADSVVVVADAGDVDGIAQATVLLCVNGGPQEQHPMALESGVATFGTWRIALGPYGAGTTLSVTVQVDDGTQLEATNPVDLMVTQSGASVTLNEILADPPAGLAGDANGDGVRDTADDEFVEIYNGSGSAVDLSGWTLLDSTGLRHTFGTGPVLQAGEFHVVFGGGTPTGIPSGTATASTGGLSLNNSGDTVLLVGADGVTRDAHTYGTEAAGDESLIRLPDGNGPWTRPGDEGFPEPFSPGAPNGVTTSLKDSSWAQVKALYR